uniref:E-beta-farnesene synthase n=1 Tax=Tanacetum cinerariifolium TaxID=118510 RepID=A0A6L2K847_TANCI|nr:E-beta-farnesene synthase [Tanacetum cinerariifolium]
MADMTAPTSQASTMASPVRTDDQILPRIRCQLDEQWFVLTKDTLREALQITPVNSNQAFITPPTAEVLINFVNELGYPKLVRHVSNGIVKRANIDYAERIWKEFTQSIHTFIQDKRNLSAYIRKNKATLIVIPSIRFTKLIIHHLQRRHRFHPRPESPLHLPNKEPVLGYLKFSAKGTKREVFGMPIPGSLITAEIREASYYQEYLAKVAQHRRYLAGKTGGVQDPPAPKPTQPARKPKSKPTKAPPRPAVISTQPAPTSAPVKPKKRSLKHVATSEAEDVPVMEPQVAAEDAELQKVLEESMKTAYALPRGKGKAKVTEKQVAHDLLSLQKPKKKSPADQYIFQRRIFKPTKSSLHDESPYTVLGQSDSEEESKKVVLEATEGGNDEDQAGTDPGAQAEGHTGTDVDPGNARDEEQSIPSPVVHAGSDREHMDLDVADVLLEDPASSSGTLSSLQHLSRDISFGDQFFSDKPSDANKNAKTKVESMVNVPIQQALSSISLMTSPIVDLTLRPESPKVHQQFKETTTDTTTTTTTTLPPPQAQQQSTAEAMMVKRIGELEYIMANLIQVNKDMEERLDKHRARLYTLEQLDIPQQVSIAVSEVVTDAVDWAMQTPLCNRFRDLPEADMKEILHQRMWETESYKTHKDHKQLFEALEKSMNRDHSEELAPSISLTPADLEMDEDMAPDEQAQLLDDEDIGSAHVLMVNLRQGWWKPFEEERPTTPEPAWLIQSSDVPAPTNNWASALASNYSPPPEDSLLTQTDDIATFIDWFCKRRGITELKPQDLKGPAYEIVKVFHPDVIHLQYQMEQCHKLPTDSVDDPLLRRNISKPLPLGGPPGQVTIQSDFFFNKDLEYLRYGSKGRRPALSISKMTAAYYPDAGLEQMVPYQFLINEECKYDIAAMYGISHWWFQRQRFYIDRHTSEGDRRTIVLRRADLNEHVIAERDFKYLYPSDFEDMYMLNLQGNLNHLPPKDKKILTTAVNQWTRQLVIRQRVEDFQLGIGSYQTQLNLTKPQWDATGFEFKYKLLDQEGRGSVQGVHVRYSKAFEDKADLSQSGELCWRTRQRGRLQTFEAYRTIKSFRHSRPLSDDL